MSKSLIIFDCDGTLVESEVIAARVFPKYWATHGVNFTETEFKERFIGTGKNAAVVVETFAKMPPHADAEGDRLFDEALARDLTAVAGIADLLRSLPVEVCAASNSSLSYVVRALKTVGLQEHFAHRVFSAEQVKAPKPAPDVFLWAASRLGFRPEDCLVIEDSPSGVKAAKAAQMKVVGFAGASHFVPSLAEKLEDTRPDWFCSSVSELGARINRWLERKSLTSP